MRVCEREQKKSAPSQAGGGNVGKDKCYIEFRSMSKNSVIFDGPSSVICVNNLWCLLKKDGKKINAKRSTLKVYKNQHHHHRQPKSNSKDTTFYLMCAVQCRTVGAYTQNLLYIHYIALHWYTMLKPVLLILSIRIIYILRLNGSISNNDHCHSQCDYSTAEPNLFMKNSMPSKIFAKSKQSSASIILRW